MCLVLYRRYVMVAYQTLTLRVLVRAQPAVPFFYPCRIMEVCLALTQEAEDRNLSGVPEESR